MIGANVTVGLRVAPLRPAPPRLDLAEWIAKLIIDDNARRVALQRPSEAEGEGRKKVQLNAASTKARKRRLVAQGKLPYVAPLFWARRRWANSSEYRVEISRVGAGVEIKVSPNDRWLAEILQGMGYRFFGIIGPLDRKIRKLYEREQRKRLKEIEKGARST